MIGGVGQESQNTAHHPTAHGFARMHSSCQHYALSLRKVLQIVTRGDRENLAIFAWKCLTQTLFLNEFGSLRVRFYAAEIAAQITERIGCRVGKVDHIQIILESISEGRRVVALTVVGNILADPILEVANILTVLVPANLLLLGLLFRVNRNLHPIIEQAVRFGVI